MKIIILLRKGYKPSQFFHTICCLTRKNCEYLKFLQSDYFNKCTFGMVVNSLGKNPRRIQCGCVKDVYSQSRNN